VNESRQPRQQDSVSNLGASVARQQPGQHEGFQTSFASTMS
jgi:hypothetical protein